MNQKEIELNVIEKTNNLLAPYVFSNFCREVDSLMTFLGPLVNPEKVNSLIGRFIKDFSDEDIQAGISSSPEIIAALLSIVKETTIQYLNTPLQNQKNDK